MDLRRFSPLLLVGDVAAFCLFALVGLRSHDEDPLTAAFARTVLPFLGAWLLVAVPAGLLNRSVNRDPAAAVKRVLLAWAPAWALGLALRSLIWDREVFTAFAIVSFLGMGLVLAAWRAAAAGVFKGDSDVSRAQ